MRVFLVRHGRTPLNAAGVLRGEIDATLDEVGRGEAVRLGQAFSGVTFELVFTSPLERARDTAACLVSDRGTDVRVDERLRDRGYGSFAGHRLEEVESQYGSVDLAPGVEPLESLLERIRASFEELVSSGGPDSTLGLVSHDVVLRRLVSDVVGGRSYEETVLPTASWCELAGESGSFRLVSCGEVAP